MRDSPTIDPTFRIVEEIGRGASSVVYRAWDSRRACEVALKTMPLASPSAAYAIKREFRVRADIRHPNLVALLELMCAHPIDAAESVPRLEGPDRGADG